MPLKTRRKRTSVVKVVSITPQKKRGPKPKAIVEFPEPGSTVWADKETFHEALALHIERHGDTAWHLHKAIIAPKDSVDHKTIANWVAGTKVPRSVSSLEILGRIEKRYRLPMGYLGAKLPRTGRAANGHTKLGDMTASERRRFAWHLPSDFDRRPLKERREILDWVGRVIVSGATNYRRYQAIAMKQRYALRFPDLSRIQRSLPLERERDGQGEGDLDDVEVELASATRSAPRALAEEVAHLIEFKTATLLRRRASGHSSSRHLPLAGSVPRVRSPRSSPFWHRRRLAGCRAPTSWLTAPRTPDMATYVLVHGGGHGGWCWQYMAQELRRQGHVVYAPTLTGLCDRAHLLIRQARIVASRRHS